MSSGDESRPSSPSLLQNIHRAKRIKFSVEPVKVTCVCEGVKTEMISKQTQVTTEDIATSNMNQRSIWDKDELKCEVSHLPNVGFEEEPKDPRNKAFARLVAHELDSVPAEKRSNREPLLGGFSIAICLPSHAPTQLLKFHFCANCSAVSFHSVSVVGIWKIIIIKEIIINTYFYLQNVLSDDDNASVATSSNSKKRKRKESLIEKQGQFINTAEKLFENLSQKDEQWEVFGRSIAYQMKDLNENQLVICQKLISDTIFCAKLCKLNENSYIVNPSNEPTFQPHNFYSPSPSSSHSSSSTFFNSNYPVRQQLQTSIQSKLYRQPVPSPSHQKSPYYNHPSPSTPNDQSHFTHHHQSPIYPPVPSPSHQKSTYYNHPSPSTPNDQSHFAHQQVQFEVDNADEFSQIVTEDLSQTYLSLPNVTEGSAGELKDFLIINPKT
ncbi:uncharacterized protein LOC113508707 [Trichoplusia ni]|uniref:Uncharacterized protein LOC113508707 n=1 Tax=Trichoplusia ni TaxID=7111 RepID=A0A7E5X312_TRINI|nr:uncharacterized protein LOC113508707 [Trichoplusia ni]